MITKTCLIVLATAFLIGSAAAQNASWPIVNGQQLQPSQHQIEHREGKTGRSWNRRVGPEIDRLYDQIMNAH